MKMRNWIILSIASLFFLGCTGLVSSKSTGVNTPDDQRPQGNDAFETGSYELVVLPDQQVAKIISLLEHAQTSLQLSMFHLSQNDIVSEIIRLAQKGVQIQIILDQTILKEPSSQLALLRLKQSPGHENIEVRPSSSGFSITHTKAFLIDRKQLMISTINFSNAISYSRDFGIIYDDPSDIAEFERVFANDWQLSGTNSNTTPTLNSPNLVWSPVNSKSKIVQLIQLSKKSLDVEIENLGAPDVQNAFLDAVRRGVRVRLVMSLCSPVGPNNNWKYMDALVAGGVQLRAMPEAHDQLHPYIHAKVILQDSENFYVGSENFSTNSLDFAREVGIVSKSSDVVLNIGKTFNQDWNNATDWAKIEKKCSATFAAETFN